MDRQDYLHLKKIKAYENDEFCSNVLMILFVNNSHHHEEILKDMFSINKSCIFIISVVNYPCSR